MKKYLAWAAFFIGVYLFFILRLVPVSQLTDRLPNNTYLINAQGSIWSGSADELIANGQVIDNVSWSFNLLSLLSFDPSFHIEMGNSFSLGPRGQFDVSGLSGEVSLSNGELKIDANQVVQQFPLIMDIVAEGEFNLTLEELTQGQPICGFTEANVAWPNAVITAYEQRVVLGNLAANLSCDNGNLIADIAKANDLGLDLQIIVSKGYKVAAKGFIKPDAKFPKALEPALDLLPSPDSKGRYKIDFQL